MRTFLRSAAVVACLFICAASASKPSQHAVQSAATINASYDATWSAVIDLFTEHNWTIQTIDKSSGFITTDWLNLGDDAAHFADCGNAPLATTAITAVRFNVRVKPSAGGTDVVVNDSFRQGRAFGNNSAVVECTSTGALETRIHGEIDSRVQRQPRPVAAPPPIAPVIAPPGGVGSDNNDAP